ncbi:unnamed protein product [Lupinus luteus]|uniref:Uncharacterized protein n=1 Tax=Lupinus luteus TaxID=3873 RepID=A0AAV1XQD5_LUPLU
MGVSCSGYMFLTIEVVNRREVRKILWDVSKNVGVIKGFHNPGTTPTRKHHHRRSPSSSTRVRDLDESSHALSSVISLLPPIEGHPSYLPITKAPPSTSTTQTTPPRPPLASMIDKGKSTHSRFSIGRPKKSIDNFIDSRVIDENLLAIGFWNLLTRFIYLLCSRT